MKITQIETVRIAQFPQILWLHILTDQGLTGFRDRTARSGAAHSWRCRINRQIVGFKKIKFYTLENVGAGKLQMPEQEMHTTAFWLHWPANFLATVGCTPTEVQNGLSGLANTLRTIASLLLMCDPQPRHLGHRNDGGSRVVPELYLYDTYPGGIGQSVPLYRMATDLVRRTIELITACPCDSGCPSCVGPVGEIGDLGKEIAHKLALSVVGLSS